jgi:hypothetical protein
MKSGSLNFLEPSACTGIVVPLPLPLPCTGIVVPLPLPCTGIVVPLPLLLPCTGIVVPLPLPCTGIVVPLPLPLPFRIERKGCRRRDENKVGQNKSTTGYCAM